MAMKIPKYWAQATAETTLPRGGGNVRVSCKTLVIPPPVPVDISALSCRNVVRSQRDPILAQQGAKINERFAAAGLLRASALSTRDCPAG